MTDVSGDRDFGEKGLQKAYDRLSGELDTDRNDDAMVTLAEVLHWCYSLEEYHVDRLGTTKDLSEGDARQEWRRVHWRGDDGETHAALTWVRNTSTHELVNVAQPLTIPGQVTTRHTPGRGPRSATQITVGRGGQLLVVWKPRADLPPPKRHAHDRDSFYDRLIAGREVRQPLQVAIGFLRNLPA